MTVWKARIVLCLCLTLSLSLLAQPNRKRDNDKSCGEFVGAFYKWYLAIALRNNPVPASDFALKDRPYVFSPELLRQLKQESEVQKMAGSNLVGLDADPFFSADGHGEGFVVKQITIKENKCWVEIHTVWDKTADVTPDVTPELELKGDRWIFVNFYYPTPSNPKALNLLDELKALRESWKANGISK